MNDQIGKRGGVARRKVMLFGVDYFPDDVVPPEVTSKLPFGHVRALQNCGLIRFNNTSVDISNEDHITRVEADAKNKKARTAQLKKAGAKSNKKTAKKKGGRRSKPKK